CQRYEFAKFDCEGAEYPIFRALGEDLSRFRYVVVEYHRDPAELKEILAGRRFAIVEDLPLKVAPWSAFPSMGILYARNLGNWE
ncbi:MAG TPA: FkbM family methyltransferase, partial [Terriglobales bacterium]|nr:FkbM family methyltransferase [Terriglobales bacterium]